MLSLGIDIETIDRFSRYAKTSFFIKKYFTDREISYCYSKPFPSRHLAGRFCAKEALIKSLPETFQNISFKDIEIINKPSGKPIICCPKLYRFKFDVSISHDKSKAIAIVGCLQYENNHDQALNHLPSL